MRAHAVVRGFASMAPLHLGLVVLAACGGGSGAEPDCRTVPPWGTSRCCPIVWTTDVPAGGNVLVNPAEAMQPQTSCTFTVGTACASGDCSALRVRIASRDLAVPVVTQLAGDIREVWGVNTGTTPARVTVAVSGQCLIECALRRHKGQGPEPGVGL